MAYFALPYRVLYHDATAHGAHHFLTNFRFQCAARELFLFTQVVDPSPNGERFLHEFLPLTHEGYSLNLAPVTVGQRVGILLSFEEPTHCSVRLCFRVVREDGAPVCCGFQTLVCTAAPAGEVIAAPEPLRAALAPIREKRFSPSFRDRVLSGAAAVK